MNLNIFVRLNSALDFLKCLGIFIFRFILSRMLCFGLPHYSSLPHSTAAALTRSSKARSRGTSCSDALKVTLLGDVDTPQSWSQKQEVLPLYRPWPRVSFCFLALTFSMLRARHTVVPVFEIYLCFWLLGIILIFLFALALLSM